MIVWKVFLKEDSQYNSSFKEYKDSKMTLNSQKTERVDRMSVCGRPASGRTMQKVRKNQRPNQTCLFTVQQNWRPAYALNGKYC